MKAKTAPVGGSGAVENIVGLDARLVDRAAGVMACKESVACDQCCFQTGGLPAKDIGVQAVADHDGAGGVISGEARQGEIKYIAEGFAEKLRLDSGFIG